MEREGSGDATSTSSSSSSDEYDCDNDSDHDSSETSNSTCPPRKTASGSGLDTTNKKSSTAVVNQHADPSSSPLIDEAKRKILDAAVDAVIDKKQLLNKARLKFRLTYAELYKALLDRGAEHVVEYSKNCRRNVKIDPGKAKLLQEAANDVVSKGMSVAASAQLHKIHTSTLSRELIDQGFPQLLDSRNSRNLEAAVFRVVEKGMGVTKAAKLHSVGAERLKKRLCELGYVMVGSGYGAKWIKAPVSLENKEAEPTAAGVNSLGSQEKEERIEGKEERSGRAQPAARKEEASEELESAIPEVEEIERIVDTRLKRQYLVKWQGEEEATWVDEDVFLGLANLQIK